ncbi:MAG: radical SAM protein [Acidobacteria bacterium]|nr:radical SAM protein [Acidobacteriota bacterium]
MTEIPERTLSLCPYCLRRIPAGRIVENGAVYLQKSCPQHGDLGKVLLWKNSPKTYQEWNRTAGVPAMASSLPSQSGCPFDCGLCPSHKQKTCTAIIEVTHRCNLECPVCFASSKIEAPPDPGLNEIAQILEMLRERSAGCPVQFSGGEPALRDDLPEIVSLAKERGFDPIQVNTNGIRLAQDEVFGRRLVDAGTTVIYLQFDGVTGSVYQKIRGADLLPFKLKAIERCADLKTGVILVPTLVKNINDGQIGDIIQFAKKWIPTVRGVHFQPMTFLGRYPSSPCNEDRILLSDILSAIEDQTGGEIRVENLVPSG